MKILFLSLFVSQAAFAGCYGPQLARDSVRAIALVSGRSQISDMVGGCAGNTCQIAANYRAANYSDLYQVSFSETECRVLSLKLLASNQPIQN